MPIFGNARPDRGGWTLPRTVPVDPTQPSDIFESQWRGEHGTGQARFIDQVDLFIPGLRITERDITDSDAREDNIERMERILADDAAQLVIQQQIASRCPCG